MHEICVFIFRRDFRLSDNVAFIEACKYCKDNKASLLPIFIFNPSQIDHNKNEYYSCNSVQFMIECLHDLRKQLLKKKGDLYYFHEGDVPAMNDIISLPNCKVGALYYNADYTPYAKERDSVLRDFCKDNDIECREYNDYSLLSDLTLIYTTTVKGKKKPYTIFTAFYNECLRVINENKNVIYNPSKYSMRHVNNVDFFLMKIEGTSEFDINKYIYPEKNVKILVHGGKVNAYKILNNLKKFKHYKKTRNIVSDKNGTTHMSAYLKYGCFSVRRVFYTILRNFKDIRHDLIRELFWREFYAYLTYHHPRILKGQQSSMDNEPMQDKYIGKRIWGEHDKTFMDAWKSGMTGFPIVDAGMRQMNTTGWIHNRLRMITASFLVKDLHIDWKEGEKYFATALVDYDPSSNNGGWQWCASIGSDAQPYFRIFNPWLQSKAHDKECEYIKEWVPELKKVDNKDIHNWANVCKLDKYKGIYTSPIVDHATQRLKIQKLFKRVV